MPRLPPQIGRRSRAGSTRGAGIHALTPVINAAEGIADGVTWDGRSSGAYHEQPDGTIVEVLPGELRVEGARRVENRCASSHPENWTGYWSGLSSWMDGVDDPFGGNNAFTADIIAREGKNTGFIVVANANRKFKNDADETVTVAVWLRSSVPRLAWIGGGHMGSDYNQPINVDAVWRCYMCHGSSNKSFPTRALCLFSTQNTNYSIDVFSPTAVIGHVEPETRLDALQNYGFGVPSVRYLAHKNGNTAGANGVIAETTGAELPTPVLLLLEPEEVNAFPSALDLLAGFSGPAVSSLHESIGSPSGELDVAHLSAGSSDSAYKAKGSVVSVGDTKHIWARTVSGEGTVSLINYHGAGNLFSVTEQWQKFTIEDDTYTGPGQYNFYLADFRAGTLSEVLVWFPHIKTGGGKITGLANGTRTADGAMRISNVPANALPYVDHINTDDKRILNTGRDNEIASYDSPSDTLIVGGDTAKTRRIASVKYDN